MKSDIQRLMAERGLDAIYVGGGEGFSDIRVYLANGADITGGVIIVKKGSDPVLIVNGMEIEEAQASGLQIASYGDIGYMRAVAEISDPTSRAVKLVEMCLQQAGVEGGRVGMYGRDAINNTMALTQALASDLPAYEFVGELDPSLFEEAMLTKDPHRPPQGPSRAPQDPPRLGPPWHTHSTGRNRPGALGPQLSEHSVPGQSIDYLIGLKHAPASPEVGLAGVTCTGRGSAIDR